MTAPRRFHYVSAGQRLSLLHERIKLARAGDSLGPITVVVPTLYSAFFVRRSLGAHRTRGAQPWGLFNVNFLRLDDLAERLARSGLDRLPLTRLKAAELVYSVVADAPDIVLGPLAPLRSHPSLTPALHRAFDELRPVPPDAIGRLRDNDEVTAAVVRLWQIFKSRSSSYSDRLETSRAAAERIAGDPEAIRAMFGSLIVMLTDEPAPPFAPLQEALLRFADAEFVVGLTGDGVADRAVRGLVEKWGGESPPRLDAEPTSGEMLLVSVPDPAEEARHVVRSILRLADGGVRFGEMAVLFRNPAYAARMDEALRAAGIPVSDSAPTPLAQSPEGRFIAGLLDVFATGFSREVVMDWLTGSPVKDPAGGVVNGSRWDAISRQAGIVRGIEQWEERLDERAGRLRSSARRGERYDELDEGAVAAKRSEAVESDALRRFITKLAEAPPPDSGRWADFIGWLRRATAAYRAPGTGGRGAAARSERIGRLMEELASLDEISGPAPDLARFTSVLGQEMSQPVRAVRGLGRGVFLGQIRDAAGSTFRTVHVLGMAEGAFPSPSRDDPLLPDRVRRSAGTGGGVLPTRPEREAAERRSYLNAIASAPERVLLWPRSEEGSNSVRGPSRWFIEAARAVSGNDRLQGSDLIKYPGRSGVHMVQSAERGLLETGRNAISTASEYTLRSIAASAAAGEKIEDHWFARSDGGKGLLRAAEVEQSRYGPDWTRWDGNLAGEPVPSPARGAPVSPTRLEAWAACPFRYFLANVLNLKPLARPEEVVSISPADRGSLIHAALEQLVQRRIDASPAALDEEQAILEIAEAEFHEYEGRGLTGNPVLWVLEKERIRRELSRFLVAERERSESTGFTASHTELTFGLERDGHPAVDIQLPGGKVIKFRGAIDRVEGSADGRVSVIDYKTGSREPYKGLEEDPLQRGHRMQLPVYAMAARQILGARGDIEAAYWFTSEKGGFELKSISLDDVEQEAVETIEKVTQGIGAGTFPAHPGGHDFVPPGAPGSGFKNCVYCDFDRVCPASRDRLWARKRHDGSMAAYTALAGEEDE